MWTTLQRSVAAWQTSRPPRVPFSCPPSTVPSVPTPWPLLQPNECWAYSPETPMTGASSSRQVGLSSIPHVPQKIPLPPSSLMTGFAALSPCRSQINSLPTAERSKCIQGCPAYWSMLGMICPYHARDSLVSSLQAPVSKDRDAPLSSCALWGCLGAL